MKNLVATIGMVLAVAMPAALSRAGDITGKVIEGFSGQGIKGVDVELVSADSTKATQTFTNDKGEYIFKDVGAGRVTLVYSRKGYSKYKTDQIHDVPAAGLVNNVKLYDNNQAEDEQVQIALAKQLADEAGGDEKKAVAIWGEVVKFDFSTSAKVAVANELAKKAPAFGKAPLFSVYASVKPDEVKNLEAVVEAVAVGKATPTSVNQLKSAELKFNSELMKDVARFQIYSAERLNRDPASVKANLQQHLNRDMMLRLENNRIR